MSEFWELFLILVRGFQSAMGKRLDAAIKIFKKQLLKVKDPVKRKRFQTMIASMEKKRTALGKAGKGNTGKGKGEGQEVPARARRARRGQEVPGKGGKGKGGKGKTGKGKGGKSAAVRACAKTAKRAGKKAGKNAFKSALKKGETKTAAKQKAKKAAENAAKKAAVKCAKNAGLSKKWVRRCTKGAWREAKMKAEKGKGRKGKCPADCKAPTIRKGSPKNGGVNLANGVCEAWASKKYGNARYCGTGKSYAGSGGINCASKGCKGNKGKPERSDKGRTCCHALTPKCMACKAGLTVSAFCSKPENAKLCGVERSDKGRVGKPERSDKGRGGSNSCPAECKLPMVHKGSSKNGGVDLARGGVCEVWASKKYGKARYCGTGNTYSNGGINCASKGCKGSTAKCPADCKAPVVHKGKQGGLQGSRRIARLPWFLLFSSIFSSLFFLFLSAGVCFVSL